MARRFRFTILDGMGLIVVLAIAFASITFYSGYVPDNDRGEVAVWLVTAGVFVVILLTHRLGLRPQTRLTVHGLAVAFAGVTDGMYLGKYVRVEAVGVAAVLGLSAVAVALVIAGAVAGMKKVESVADERPDGNPE